MEILLATCINIALYNRESEYVGVSFSNYFTIGLFTIAVGLPIWVIIFFLRNIHRWEDEEFEEKHGAVLEGTRI